MTNAAGRFVWYEYVTEDLGAARDFYGSVIGWDARRANQSEPEYWLLRAGGQDVAGLMRSPPARQNAGAPPAWYGYIAVDDVDAAAARLTTAGGAIHRAPDDIPGVGRFAIAADPQGAAFFLFTPSGGPGPAPDAMPGPGHVGWRELTTSDGGAAFDFYAGQFGWTKDQAMPMGERGVYQLVASGPGAPAFGAMVNRADPAVAPAWLFYFAVPELDAALARVGERGGAVMVGAQEVPGGAWIGICRDPQGAAFAIVAPRR